MISPKLFHFHYNIFSINKKNIISLRDFTKYFKILNLQKNGKFTQIFYFQIMKRKALDLIDRNDAIEKLNYSLINEILTSLATVTNILEYPRIFLMRLKKMLIKIESFFKKNEKYIYIIIPFVQ
ncbi:hypothetical protein BpHYR1_018890 [Brachionus plicatilis]|uniref:Uncharacterized protein n=1 Tax=Brachionus plicatilis TaxID=10195 RepID=A0A3M7R6N7_BRAPC|nr:hypothetical protein BpHYR1_018890 [Brachionus plicatilis]